MAGHMQFDKLYTATFVKEKSATNWSKKLQLKGMAIVTSHFVYGAMKNVLFHENFFDVFISQTFFNCI